MKKLFEIIFHPIRSYKEWRLKKKYIKNIKYWRENPDVFFEKMLGMRLFDYQKKILKEAFDCCQKKTTSD